MAGGGGGVAGVATAWQWDAAPAAARLVPVNQHPTAASGPVDVEGLLRDDDLGDDLGDAEGDDEVEEVEEVGEGGDEEELSVTECVRLALDMLRAQPGRAGMSIHQLQELTLRAAGATRWKSVKEVEISMQQNPRVVWEPLKQVYRYVAKYTCDDVHGLLRLLQQHATGLAHEDLIDTYPGAAVDIERLTRTGGLENVFEAEGVGGGSGSSGGGGLIRVRNYDTRSDDRCLYRPPAVSVHAPPPPPGMSGSSGYRGAHLHLSSFQRLPGTVSVTHGSMLVTTTLDLTNDLCRNDVVIIGGRVFRVSSAALGNAGMKARKEAAAALKRVAAAAALAGSLSPSEAAADASGGGGTHDHTLAAAVGDGSSAESHVATAHQQAATTSELGGGVAVTAATAGGVAPRATRGRGGRPPKHGGRGGRRRGGGGDDDGDDAYDEDYGGGSSVGRKRKRPTRSSAIGSGGGGVGKADGVAATASTTLTQPVPTHPAAGDNTDDRPARTAKRGRRGGGTVMEEEAEEEAEEGEEEEDGGEEEVAALWKGDAEVQDADLDVVWDAPSSVDDKGGPAGMVAATATASAGTGGMASLPVGDYPATGIYVESVGNDVKRTGGRYSVADTAPHRLPQASAGYALPFNSTTIPLDRPWDGANVVGLPIYRYGASTSLRTLWHLVASHTSYDVSIANGGTGEVAEVGDAAVTAASHAGAHARAADTTGILSRLGGTSCIRHMGEFPSSHGELRQAMKMLGLGETLMEAGTLNVSVAEETRRRRQLGRVRKPHKAQFQIDLAHLHGTAVGDTVRRAKLAIVLERYQKAVEAAAARMKASGQPGPTAA